MWHCWATATVLSVLWSSTRMMSSTRDVGISSSVFRSVFAALYAGRTTAMRLPSIILLLLLRLR